MYRVIQTRQGVDADMKTSVRFHIQVAHVSNNDITLKHVLILDHFSLGWWMEIGSPPPPREIADISYLEEQSKRHRIRYLCQYIMLNNWHVSLLNVY